MNATNQINSQNQNTATMMETYRVGNAGAVKRIGAPHEHDVLSGRGGAINSHVGNTRFREWVRERKNRYNLARTKAEKARVANEVMDLVRNQNPPGRFLQRDQSSVTGGVTWWTEVDEVKAMAKTSQALREGAPSIRAAHKDDLGTVKKRTRKTTKRSLNSSALREAPAGNANKRSHQVMQERTSMPVAPTMTMTMTTQTAQPPVPAPQLELSQSQAMQQLKANVEAAQHNNENTMPPLTAPRITRNYLTEQPLKRSRLSENLYLPLIPLPQPHIVKPDDETPPLEPMPSPVPLSAIPELNFPMPAIPKRESSIRRSNSLALSDVGAGSDNWGDVEFVNPFEGDTSDEINTMPPFDPLVGVSRPRNSISNTSIKSELSDLCDVNANTRAGESEFGEAMKGVYDAVHPGLASPGQDEPIPTHLYPYRGSFDLTRGSDSIGGPQLIC